MSPGRWLQVKTIFHGAAERSPAERLEFLRESCGSVLDLRKEVESRVIASAVARALKKNPEQRWANGRRIFARLCFLRHRA